MNLRLLQLIQWNLSRRLQIDIIARDIVLMFREKNEKSFGDFSEILFEDDADLR